MASISSFKEFDAGGIKLTDQSGLITGVTRVVGGTAYRVLINNLPLSDYYLHPDNLYKNKNVIVMSHNNKRKLEFIESIYKYGKYVTSRYFVNVVKPENDTYGMKFYMISESIVDPDIDRAPMPPGFGSGAGAGAGPGAAAVAVAKVIEKPQITSNMSIVQKAKDALNKPFSILMEKPQILWCYYNNEEVVMNIKKEGVEYYFWFHPSKASEGKTFNMTKKNPFTFCSEDPKLEIDMLNSTINGNDAKLTSCL